MTRTYDAIVLGSGPAGLTAAIYLARGGHMPLVVEGMQPGGQLTTTTEVENFPGFPEGITGPELMAKMREQAERFGATIVQGEVEDVDFSKHPRIVRISGSDYIARTVIITTGANPKRLGIEGEQEMMGKGVSYCATCDGFFFRDKIIAVAGGGDSAAEEATFLSRFGSKVLLIHRRDALRASKAMQDKVFADEKVEMQWNKVIKGFIKNEQGLLAGLELEDTVDGSIVKVDCQGLFVAIGHRPNTAFLKDAVELDEGGYINLKRGHETSVSGVYAAGDVMDHCYRQAITSAGSGCSAALEAIAFLSRGHSHCE